MHNDIGKIYALLARYYEGSTTESEEQELKLFFEQAEDVPEDMTVDKNLFMSLQKMNDAITPSADFEHRLLTTVCGLEKSRKSRIRRWSFSIAASVGLILSIGSYMLIKSNDNPYEIKDERLAYAKTEEALLLVSQKLNKVDAGLSKMNFTLNKLTTEKKNEKNN